MCYLLLDKMKRKFYTLAIKNLSLLGKECLKQAARDWYNKHAKFLIKKDLKEEKQIILWLLKQMGIIFCFLQIYLDDLLFVLLMIPYSKNFQNLRVRDLTWV